MVEWKTRNGMDASFLLLQTAADCTAWRTTLLKERRALAATGVECKPHPGFAEPPSAWRYRAPGPGLEPPRGAVEPNRWHRPISPSSKGGLVLDLALQRKAYSAPDLKEVAETRPKPPTPKDWRMRKPVVKDDPERFHVKLRPQRIATPPDWRMWKSPITEDFDCEELRWKKLEVRKETYEPPFELVNGRPVASAQQRGLSLEQRCETWPSRPLIPDRARYGSGLARTDAAGRAAAAPPTPAASASLSTTAVRASPAPRSAASGGSARSEVKSFRDESGSLQAEAFAAAPAPMGGDVPCFEGGAKRPKMGNAVGGVKYHKFQNPRAKAAAKARLPARA